MNRFFFAYLWLLFAFACNQPVTKVPEPEKENRQKQPDGPRLLILGTLQDGGAPHAGCTKACCAALFSKPDNTRKVVALGLIDPANKQTFLFEATPDLATQMKELKTEAGFKTHEAPDGIFLTHAHIGHYAGLMYLGREAMNTRAVKVYAMPKMKLFLENNGPWNQLVKLKNIFINSLEENKTIAFSSSFSVTPFTVPHRDEYSKTIGYLIQGPHKSALFIPDIDKWEKWHKSIIEVIHQVDYAFIDGTFYDANEINNRNIKEIPHPFVIESMKLFENLPATEKSKIYFIHLNHTNPLLLHGSEANQQVFSHGMHVATKGDAFQL